MPSHGRSPAPRPPARRSARQAPGVRRRRAVADAAGPFNALGATLFWGAWGYKFDRPRLERNLHVLSAAGIDYVRVLGSVGGASWEDRETDPRWPDYDAIIAGMTDLAYDRYGMRVQWTLFGGAPSTASATSRTALVDRFAALARGREHKIFAFEIANEAWQNGFRGAEGLLELRTLATRLNDKTSVLVALSSPQGNAACATYAGAGADAMTLHYDRGFGNEGPIAPLCGGPGAFQRHTTVHARRVASCRLQQRADRARELGQAGRFAVENCRGVRDDLPRRQRRLRSARRSGNSRRRRGGQFSDAPAPCAFR